jgi:flagellar M-ring protein FliF
MDQILRLFAALSTRQKITIAITALAVVGGLVSVSRWRTESDFRPLYTSLSPEDAGAVVQKLKESGTEFRLSENGTSVLAPSSRVAELRLEMASAGLPKTGRIGFELFDKNNLGVTEFTEHVNYARALEGELERSITSLTEIEQARVHLTFPKDSVFLESKAAAKASIVLRLRPGAKLSGQNVNAIVNLVASAVEGLAPEAVTLVDSRGQLLNRARRAGDADGVQPSEASLDYRQKIESDLLAKINSTLDPLLGSDKFRAGVSVECDFSSGEQSEETLDPNKSVMQTSQKTEENSGSAVSAGAAGTAANLPRPPGKVSTSGNGISRKTENISYQTSRLVRHTKLPQGTVKRVSISVLLDQEVKWQGTGAQQKRVLTPPSPERMKSIKDLVAGATGLSTERGDQLVVETLPFEATLSADPPAAGPMTPTTDPRIPRWLFPIVSDMKLLILTGAAMILIPSAAIVVFFLMARKKKIKVEAAAALAEGVPGTALPEGAEEAGLAGQLDPTVHNKLLEIPTKKTEVLLKQARETIHADNFASLNVLRTWLNEAKSGDGA